MPWISGAGEATVVTTDALGRQVSTSVPFYVSNTLLREGLSDFDFTLGALRNNYGIKNADYGAGAVSAIYRYGLTHWLTLSAHTEDRQGLTNAGLGGDIGEIWVPSACRAAPAAAKETETSSPRVTPTTATAGE